MLVLARFPSRLFAPACGMTCKLLSEVAMAKLVLSVLFLCVSSISLWAQQPVDYRSRTIYFMVTDRFHPHQPYSPYVDPEYPDATNSVDCFSVQCPEEEQWRKYWGGDPVRKS